MCSSECHRFILMLMGCYVKTNGHIENLKTLFHAHPVEDFTHKNSLTFDESSSSLSIWHVVHISEVFRMLLGNKGLWETDFLMHTTTA